MVQFWQRSEAHKAWASVFRYLKDNAIDRNAYYVRRVGRGGRHEQKVFVGGVVMSVRNRVPWAVRRHGELVAYRRRRYL